MSKRLTILVDMDDTLENLLEEWVKFLNEEHNLRVDINNVTNWDMSKTFTMLSRQEIYAPLFNKSLWERVKPLPGAVQYVNRLIKDGHRVVIVTASHQDTVSIKLNDVLFKYFPFFTYKDVIITSQKQLINGDILIDDAPHNLEGGKYKGILMTAPHNKSYKAEEHGLVRVNDWEEIYKLINK